MFRSIALAAVLSAFAAAPAMADCTVTNPYIKAYLATFPGWHVVTEADLVPGDPELWRQYNGDACPGLASADLRGDGRPSYSLIMTDGVQVRAVILLSNNMGFGEHILFERAKGVTPVTFGAESGDAFEFETREKVHLPHQSLIVAQLEAWAVQYYWQDGKLKDVTISD